MLTTCVLMVQNERLVGEVRLLNNRPFDLDFPLQQVPFVVE